MSILKDIHYTVQLDLNDLIVGDHIASGFYRKVYNYHPDSRCVIKLETTDSSHFHNANEWTFWNEMKETKWAKWLAPCCSISSNGTCLIQVRTTPLVGNMPKKIPNFMNDTKRGNWGMLEGRPVLHDYGHSEIHGIAMKQFKMIKYNPKKFG